MNNMNTLMMFTGSWCKPCLSFKPTIKKVLEDYPDVKLDIIDVDENQDLVAEKGIKAVPTIMMGSTVHMGAMNESNLREWLDKALLK